MIIVSSVLFCEVDVVPGMFHVIANNTLLQPVVSRRIEDYEECKCVAPFWQGATRAMVINPRTPAYARVLQAFPDYFAGWHPL